MLREVLHSKIHRATVTAALPHYVGSITIDEDWLRRVGMRVSDKVAVANCRNGARFETYIFRGEPGSRKIEVNGAAAHLVEAGDKLIIMHYALMDDREYAKHKPKVLVMSEDGDAKEELEYEPGPKPAKKTARVKRTSKAKSARGTTSKKAK
ncbi:MAG TPA: aspartate 1-decarboxylase [Phycisphaerales bacterium]|nr:aspartate 1-decarboxylase [Phycisphaerales bacterium]